MPRASRAPLTAILAFALIPLLFHTVIVETRHVRPGFAPAGLFKIGFIGVSAISYWGIYSSLLLMFGLTLRPGREPLITSMARRMHGEVSDEVVRYTRRVTFAWCVFFGCQFGVSVALFCFAPLVAWSTFVNILDIPMVLAMFVGEYFCRLHFLCNPPRESLSVILNLIADPAGRRDPKLVPGSLALRD